MPLTDQERAELRAVAQDAIRRGVLSLSSKPAPAEVVYEQLVEQIAIQDVKPGSYKTCDYIKNVVLEYLRLPAHPRGTLRRYAQRHGMTPIEFARALRTHRINHEQPTR